MNPQKEKRQRLYRRKKSIRKHMFGTSERPRLSVYRSLKHIYCQIIDDTAGKTLVAVSSAGVDFKNQVGYGGNKKAAKVVGENLAKAAQEKGIKKIVFDRNGRKYHGRIKELAEAARSAGLEF